MLLQSTDSGRTFHAYNNTFTKSAIVGIVPHVNNGVLCAADSSVYEVYASDVGVDERPVQPEAPSLAAYPNPFGSALNVRLDGTMESPGSMIICDALGRTVGEASISPTAHEVTFSGDQLPSGVYTCVVVMNHHRMTTTVAHLR